LALFGNLGFILVQVVTLKTTSLGGFFIIIQNKRKKKKST